MRAAQQKTRAWLDDELIFWEDLDQKRSDAREVELQNRQIERAEQLRHRLDRVFRAQRNSFPVVLLDLIVAYRFSPASSQTFSRHMFVHVPQHLRSDAFGEDLKSQFEEWWQHMQTKQDCAFVFSHDCLRPTVGGLNLDTGADLLLGDDPFEKNSFYQWPLLDHQPGWDDHNDETHAGFFPNILRHKEFRIVFNPHKTLGCHFRGVMPLKAAERLSAGAQGTPGLGPARLCPGLSPSSKAAVPFFLNFTSRTNVKDFVQIMKDALLHPGEYEGTMILPGLSFRSLSGVKCCLVERQRFPTFSVHHTRHSTFTV